MLDAHIENKKRFWFTHYNYIYVLNQNHFMFILSER